MNSIIGAQSPSLQHGLGYQLWAKTAVHKSAQRNAHEIGNTLTRQGTTGVGGEGTWKLSKDGFCTTWKSSKETCFTLVTAGEKRWSVMKGKASVGSSFTIRPAETA